MIKTGVKIEYIYQGSPAEKAGLKPGDRIISINKHPVKDAIDIMFYSSGNRITIAVLREEKILNFTIHGSDNSLGIEVEPFRIKRCRNKCLFCFVEQLPKGLRKSLYIKDEDYRASFLYGNYITLTNLNKKDYERIKKFRLSPLYVSVHATLPEIRNMLIGNYDAPPIIMELKKLSEAKIRVHAQVVLCPGINDGEVLEKTILDLHKLYPYVASIAIVPVGITKYHKNGISTVTKNKAEEVIKSVEFFQKRYRKKHGVTFVYLADEFYIKAGKPFPPLNIYDDLPQIENGVGMVPFFMNKAMKINISQLKTKNRFVTFTGYSFYPYLFQFIERFKRKNIFIDVYPLENNLFGETVTVTGLLTGEDIIKGLASYIEPRDCLLIPDVTMKDTEDVFIDDLTVKDIENVLKVKAVKIGTEPEDLFFAIKKLCD
jgi:putative radical SAM enzyme (TIGR03279 family)